MAKNKLKARDIIIPIGLFVLLIVVIIEIVNVGVQQGWAVAFFAIVYVLAAFAVIALVVLYRRLGKHE